MSSKKPVKKILKKEAIQELIKCHDDPIYFIENYCYVRHPTRGKVLFKLYEYQKESVRAYVAYDRVIVNKPRQMGYSTLTAAFVAWYVFFHNDKSVLFLANKQDVAKNLLKKVKLILAEIPDWMLLADLTVNQAHSLEFSNGSSVKAVATSEDAGRSEALSLLIIDEAGIIKNFDEIWKSVKSTVSTGGKIIAGSTPKGIGNWFYETYTKAETGENEWHPLLFNWWDNPDYAGDDLEEDPNIPGGHTSTWFRKETKDMTIQHIRQELLTSFLESGETFLDVSVIQRIQKEVSEPVLKPEEFEGEFWIWRAPEKGKKYLVSCDVASGGAGGEDYCTAQIIELKEMEQVAEYKSKITPDVLAEKSIDICKLYNNAYLVIENNGIGLAANLVAKRLDYKNLAYFDKDTGRLLDKWTAEYKMINPGYAITPKSRPVVLAKFQEFVNKEFVKINSKRLANELLTFVVSNGKPQASSGKNDDLVMAFALAIWVRDVCPDFGFDSSKIDLAKLYSYITVNSTSLSSVASSDEAKAEEKRNKIREAMEKEMYREMPGGHKVDLSWIYKG